MTDKPRRRDNPDFEAAVRAAADLHKVQAMVAYIGPAGSVVGVIRCAGEAGAAKVLRGAMVITTRTLRNLAAMIDHDDDGGGEVFDLVKQRKAAL